MHADLLLVTKCILVALTPRFCQVLLGLKLLDYVLLAGEEGRNVAYLNVVLLQEEQHSLVVLERYSLRCGVRFERRHVGSVCRQSLQNRSCQACRV